MNEIDILVNAGLSRTNAEMVTALYAMASALGPIAASHQGGPPVQQPPAPTEPVPVPDIPPAPSEGAAVVSGEVVGVHDE